MYLQELLSITCANITLCTLGKEAIETVRKGHVHIVLMDVQLPDINGLEAIKEIRSFNTNIAVIVQTAYAMHSDKIAAINAGCNYYVSKPIDGKKLLLMINDIVTKLKNDTSIP
ncbi:MAG: response regulator [Bacteroidales bacterium]|nr:response regulator [Bacteroidales bacterium]